jgi:hypothetical protein
MLLAVATAAAIAAQPAADSETRRQATATVRIVRATPLHFADLERQEPGTLRTSVGRSRDGRREPIRLYEYQ